MLFPIISDKKRKGVLCAAIIFSLLIEITQLLFALGSTDVDDLIFNVLGAYIGYLLVYQTDLFILSKYDIDIENSELVEIFIDTPATTTGRYVELDNWVLEVEKVLKAQMI